MPPTTARAPHTFHDEISVDHGGANADDDEYGWSSSSSLCREWPRTDIVTAIPWGTRHPDIKKTNLQRVAWSPAEVKYIRDFCENHKYNKSIKTMNSKCWRHTVKDKVAIPIFHPNHVLDASRFHAGYHKYKKNVEDY